MKKIFLICVNFLILFSFFSCKEKSVADTNFSIPENASSVGNTNATGTQSAVSASSDERNSAKIDYDLSVMNSNMVYAEVFNMMVEPEIYDDKVVKMRGNFAVYENSPTANGGKAYAVIISDALACCQTGIEFKYDFNGNEPKDGDIITVTGKYVTAMLPGDVVFNYVKADSVEM